MSENAPVIARDKRERPPTVAELNREKKRRPCLRCGRMFDTDRCHRICPTCHRRHPGGAIREV